MKPFLPFALVMLSALSLPAHTQDRFEEMPAENEAPRDIPPLDQLQRLTGDEIRELFVGVGRDGAYNWDGMGRTTPAYWERLNEDGTFDYSDDAFPDAPGRWAIIGDTLCFNYIEPAIGGPHCFAEFISGNCVISVGVSGFFQNERMSYRWNSISVIEGEKFNCAPSIV